MDSKCEPWIFNLVNKRLNSDTNQELNANNNKNKNKYIGKINQIHYRNSTNALFQFNNELSVSDGQYKIRAYVNSLNCMQHLTYKQNEYIDLKKFIVHMDDCGNNIYLIILTSELCVGNISLYTNQNIKQAETIVNTFKSNRLSDSTAYKINATSVKLFFPYPIFKKPKYLLVYHTNQNQNDNNLSVPPTKKKKKLNHNSLKINNILGKDQVIETILTSLAANVNNNESKKNAFAVALLLYAD
eukprot:496685_1